MLTGRRRFLGAMLSTPLFSILRPRAGECGTLGGVTWEITREDRLRIRYALNGTNPYTVSLSASLDNGKTFDILPKAVTGDIGDGILPGTATSCEWDVFRDRPSLAGTLVVRITATEEPKPPLSKWFVAGALLATGAMLYGLRSASKQQKNPDQPEKLITSTVIIIVSLPE
jgi:hypothetical protein